VHSKTGSPAEALKPQNYTGEIEMRVRPQQ